MKRLFLVLCSLLALAGCDAFVIEDLRPGVSTAAEVHERLGAPDREWRNADGTVTWEFSQQPAGTTCYLITLDGAQVVQRVEQVLTETQFARVRPGLSATQVRRLLGKPARTSYFELKREVVWDWRIGRTPSDESIYFNVYFGPRGTVVRTGRETEQRNG